MYKIFFGPRVLSYVAVLALVVSLCSSVVYAGGGGSSSSGSNSSSGGNNSGGGFSGSVSSITSSSGSGSITVFSSGNANFTVNSGGNTSDSFAAMSGGTASYSNGDGTYNTVTVPVDSGGNNNNGGGGYSQGAYGGGATCPSGYTLYNGACYPNSSCTTTNSGGKGATSVTTCTTPPPTTSTTPITPATPTSPLPSSSKTCSIDGVKVDNGSSGTFFKAGSVPYNQTCSSTVRSCDNGTLSGDASYTFATCVVNPAPAMTGIYINAIPPIIRYGESSNIVWDGGNAETCTVTGPSLQLNAVTGSTTVTNITGESRYVLKCTLGPSTHSATTTIKVLPTIKET